MKTRVRNYAAPGEEPKKLLLRRKDIILWTGVSEMVFDNIASVDPILLPFKRFRENGAKYYLKDDVIKVFFKRFKGSV